MTREKFPEKIPFRLTRMLINAMEVRLRNATLIIEPIDHGRMVFSIFCFFIVLQVTGIDGTYRKTCESVMSVLHRNKDSLMAVLEAFVYDPLLNWRLIEGGVHGGAPGVVPVRSKASSTPSVAVSVLTVSEGANSEADTLSEAANNSLNVNSKKQMSLNGNGMFTLARIIIF